MLNYDIYLSEIKVVDVQEMCDSYIIVVGMNDQNHINRIKKELKEAGITAVSMARFSSGYIPRIIHTDEHILAAIYGHRKAGKGIFGYEIGLLIATDQRVIYIIHRPGFTTLDEMQFDLISGVNVVNTGLFASVTLYTGIANYVLSFTRPRAAQHFANTIEKILFEKGQSDSQQTVSAQTQEKVSKNEGVLDFMKSHNIAVLSTIERSGLVSGAAIFYIMIDNFPYFMTKTNTSKVGNMSYHHNIALTIYDNTTLQTVQLQGIAEVQSDPAVVRAVENALHDVYPQKIGLNNPPVKHLAGQSVIYKVVPTKTSFINYSIL